MKVRNHCLYDVVIFEKTLALVSMLRSSRTSLDSHTPDFLFYRIFLLVLFFRFPVSRSSFSNLPASFFPVQVSRFSFLGLLDFLYSHLRSLLRLVGVEVLLRSFSM